MTDQPCPSCGTYPPWHKVDCSACRPYQDGTQFLVQRQGCIVTAFMKRNKSWQAKKPFTLQMIIRPGQYSAAHFDPTHWMPKPEGPRSE